MASTLLALIGLFAFSQAAPLQDVNSTIDLRMPGVHPKMDDTYLCYAKRMPQDTAYITGFVPHAQMDTAHHMLVYSCQQGPGKEGSDPWICGEMHKDGEETEAICNGDSSILYAWAMDAPQLKLPQGVGFPIGGQTSAPWLVIQVHYKTVAAIDKNGDDSGITFEITKERQPKTAGVYLSGTMGQIPPHSTVYMESACQVEHEAPIHPFAFRTHTHKHGKVVAGYRVRDGEWTEIGRANPQKPQMFYPVNHPMTIKQGDILASRCTMQNDDDKTVYIGNTQNDEMCNFYMMYYVEDGDDLVEENICFNDGPPEFSWSKISVLQGAPQNASVDPDTGKFLAQTEKIFTNIARNMEQNMEHWLDRMDEIRKLNVFERELEKDFGGRYEEELEGPY